MFVGAILKALTVGAQAYAPAGRDHLAAHLRCASRPQRHVGKISVLDRLLLDPGCADTKPLGQVLSRARNRIFFSESHFWSGALRILSR